MKTFITLMLLSLAPAAFSSASWKLSCTNKKEGVSFSNNNGIAKIQFKKVNENGSITKTSMGVKVENYDIGDEEKPATVKWVGKEKIISDVYESSCNGGHALTVFSQKVEIKRQDSKKSQIIEVICHDETILASADGGECSEE